jgi:hypothetical protein
MADSIQNQPQSGNQYEKGRGHFEFFIKAGAPRPALVLG